MTTFMMPGEYRQPVEPFSICTDMTPSDYYAAPAPPMRAPEAPDGSLVMPGSTAPQVPGQPSRGYTYALDGEF
jgi:hypothetical protein